MPTTVLVFTFDRVNALAVVPKAGWVAAEMKQQWKVIYPFQT
jgi:hypothetical protein